MRNLELAKRAKATFDRIDAERVAYKGGPVEDNAFNDLLDFLTEQGTTFLGMKEAQTDEGIEEILEQWEELDS